MSNQRKDNAAILDPQHWEEQYDQGRCAWETDRPSPELRRILAEYHIPLGRALELGCGTGSSAVWLAKQGFAVTAVDLSPRAIKKAKQRAQSARVTVDFRTEDLTNLQAPDGPFDFFFDGGCYHAVRLADRAGYFQTLLQITRPGTLGLILLGNANEPEESAGPPVVPEAQVQAEWGKYFNIIHLRPFRFDAVHPGEKRYLGWSCFVKR